MRSEDIKKRIWTKLMITAGILLIVYHVLRMKGRACRIRKMARKDQEA